MNNRAGQPDTILKRRRLPVRPIRSSAPASEQLQPIVFKGTGAYRVAGPESHQVYCFSSQDPEQMIDARDVDALLRIGLFRTAD